MNQHESEASGILIADDKPENLRSGTSREQGYEEIAEHRKPSAALQEKEELFRERKKMEESLKENEEKYRSLVENLSDALYMTDTEGSVLYISPVIEKIVGLTPEEIIGRHLSDFFHPEDLPLIWEKFRKMISGQDTEPSEVRVFHKSGKVIWIRTSSRLHIRNGVISGLQGLITDITARKHAEEALKRSNSVLKAQQEASIDGILTIDENKNIIDYNQRFIEIWNIPDDIVRFRDDRKLLRHMLSGLGSPDKFLEKIRYLYENIYDIGQDEIETTDGRTFEWYCAPIISSENQYLGKIWFFRDISERRRNEQALLEEEERYRNLIENISDVVYILDPKGFFIYVSPVVRSVAGYEPEEIVGRNMAEFIHPEDLPILYDQFQKVKSGQKARILEYRMYKKSGEIFWGRTSNRVNFKDGDIRNVHGIITDITERKRVEESLQRSEALLRDTGRMAKIGGWEFDIETEKLIWTDEVFTIHEVDSDYEPTVSKSLDFYAPESKPFMRQALKRAVEYGEAFDLELRFITAKGNHLWVHSIGKAFRQNGKTIRISGTFQDITERMHAEEKIRQILTEQKIILDYAAVGIAFIKSRVFVWLNKYMENMFGYSKEEIIGTGTEQIYPSKESFEELGKNAYPLLMQGKTYQIEWLMKHKDNTLFWCSLTGIAVNPKNINEGSIWLMQDIDQKKLAEQEILRAKEAAESANRAKSEFLANMSHEIRTPMNAILGFADILDKRIEDEQLKKYLSLIRSGGKTLLGLINDILDLSKIEAGKLELEYAPINPVSIFQEIGQIFSQKTADKGLEFRIETDSDMPKHLLLDEIRLRQILLNLVGNAIKFTDTGYVKISAKCNMQNAKSDAETAITLHSSLCTLHLEVEDTGIGIPKAQRESIFGAFDQVRGQSTRQYGGTGLGLTITKRLVNMMGGEISVESELGKGSTFHVVIKNVSLAAADESEKTKKFPILYDSVKFEKALLLLVDDIEQNRLLIKIYLSSYNEIRIIEAENGQEAVDLARRYTPDIILMDMKMPVMDGYEATKAIRTFSDSVRIPIIALTADAVKEHITEIEQICDAYLSKPIDQSKLISVLSEFLPYTLMNTSSDDRKTKQSEEYSPDAETLSRFPELIQMLESRSKVWEELSDTFFIDDIQDFGNQIRQLGKTYNYPPLIVWGKNLVAQAEMFDIEALTKTMKAFPGLIRQIRDIEQKMKQNGKEPL